ncbi:MAG TPA: BON domain-containing protein [Pyrinomonadaceae bacterium]|jgi:hypothetical protein|nr:BON domain-containing protein [Pyrinomonadaceae bacterium]
MYRDNSPQKRIVIETSSGRYRPATKAYAPKRNFEVWVALSVIAAGALATFVALFLTSRPYDPMSSTFSAQQTVPAGSATMQSSPTPSPSPTTAATPATQSPEPTAEVAAATPDDATIQAQIDKVLRSDAALAELDVSTIVEGGRVTIVGSVRSVELKQRVERVIRSIKGVVGIDNQLVVIEGTPL